MHRPRLAAGGAIHGAVAWRCGYALLVRPPRPRCNPRAPCLYARPVRCGRGRMRRGRERQYMYVVRSANLLPTFGQHRPREETPPKKSMQEYRQHLRPPPSPFTKERKTYTAPPQHLGGNAKTSQVELKFWILWASRMFRQGAHLCDGALLPRPIPCSSAAGRTREARGTAAVRDDYFGDAVIGRLLVWRVLDDDDVGPRSLGSVDDRGRVLTRSRVISGN